MKTTRRSMATKALHHLRGLWKRRKEISARTARRSFFFEPLESRSLLAGDLASHFSVQAEGEGENTAPSFLAISDQTVLNGAPLWLGIDGSDAESNPITYTVTSSNPSVVGVTVPTGNKTLVLNVQSFGTMKIQLFDNLVPRVTSAIEGPASAGFYDGLTFHRVINNFMIQGGAADGAGGPNPSVPDFDDQYLADLQFTSPGLIAMAKGLDDSNDTQFFITDTTSSLPRHLDFNHSIFGRLTEGDSVREAISNVAVSGSVPVTPVVISSASILNSDPENAAFMLKALAGSGSSDITVTATDSLGATFSRTFNVMIGADAFNASPFLSDIAAVHATAGAASLNFQLQGNDVEGDAIYYDAVKIGSVNYTVSVNHATGLVTVSPPAGFVGSFQVQVSAKALAQQNTPDADQSITDVQKVTVHIDPLAPTGVDLLAGSDSGASATDNITNATSVQFQISGVTNGAVVRLYEGNNVLAQGTAVGTTATINFANIAALGEGVHNFSATQTVNGSESAKSAALAVTYDATAPGAFTSTPPTAATVGALLSYNVQNPGEGTAGFVYLLTSPPTGVSIDANTGVVSWIPTGAQVGPQTFGIKASDAAGNFVTQTVNVTVAQPVVQLAELQLNITDLNHNVITTLHVGDDFLLRGSTRDLRADPKGVYALFADLNYDTSKVQVTGAIQFNGQYTVGTSGTTTPGIVEEVGAVSSSISPINGGLKLLFEIPMKVIASGQLNFSTDAAEALPAHDVLLFNQDPVVTSAEVRYGSLSIGVDTTFTAADDVFNFNEDTSNNTLAVLANDTIVPGSGNVLTISATGATSHGGTVTIAADSKSLRYTPVPNFSGSETFTYTVRNQNNETATATTTVQVAPVNDAPTAAADTFSVPGESLNNVLDVLLNDSSSPDTGETLTVSAVAQGNHGGSVQIGTGGAFVRYSPAVNFEGTETFNYTLSDGHGGTAQGTATVTVTHVNHNPVATADTLTVSEDSSATTVNVLTNDNTGIDTGETLTITAVGIPNHGGAATLAADHLSVSYAPAANFQGTETFTYTLIDGNGGTATGVVTVTVTNVNDTPTATADTVTGFKNTTNVFNVLANDLSAPDPAESFLITAVTQPAHGTVTITNNGTRVTYTPTADYTGSDAFTYTMQDPGGLSATAAANVTVQDFIPSELSGRIFVDVNQNGEVDGLESGVANVEVRLTGTITGGQTVNLTTHSAADGSYLFENLAPGDYKIKQVQPAFLLDGSDSVGSQGGTVSANDEITIHLNQDTTGVANNFGEIGKPSQMTKIEEYFATNVGHNVLAAVAFASPANSLSTTFGTPVAAAWQTITGSQWRQFHDFKFALSGDNSKLQIDVKNAQNQSLRSTIPVADRSLIISLGQQANGTLLIKLLGSPAQFNFTVVPNVAPVVAADSLTLNEGASATINVAVNDSDSDGTLDLSSVVVTQNPANGSAVVNTNGTVTYTHNGSETTTDSFRYTIKDNSGAVSSTATAAITVTPVNDAPVALANSASVSSGAAVVVNVAANDTDSDGTLNLASIALVQQPASGAVVVNTDGTVTYTHNGSAATSDSFSYTISDNSGAVSAAAVVSISVAEGEFDLFEDLDEDAYQSAVDAALASEEDWLY